MFRHYRGAALCNPYFSERRRKRSWKKRLLLPLICFFILIGGLFVSPLLSVSNIQVVGAHTHTDDEIRDAVRSQLSARSRLPWIDATHIEAHLKQTYPLTDARVKKQYPHTLLVTIAEPSPQVRWQSGAQSVLLDQAGNVLPGATTDTTPFTIVDNSQTPVPASHVMEPTELATVLRISQTLQHSFSLTITVMKLDTPATLFGKFSTKDGWDVVVDLSANADTELAKLAPILAKLGAGRSHLHYIDLRFTDRVYYQ